MNGFDFLGWSGLVIGLLGFPPVWKNIEKVSKRARRKLIPFGPQRPRVIAELTDQPNEIRFRNPENVSMRKFRAVQNVTSPAGRAPIAGRLRPGSSVIYTCPTPVSDDDWINVSYFTIGQRFPPVWWERIILPRLHHDEMIHGYEIVRDGDAGLLERVRQFQESPYATDTAENRAAFRDLSAGE